MNSVSARVIFKSPISLKPSPSLSLSLSLSRARALSLSVSGLLMGKSSFLFRKLMGKSSAPRKRGKRGAEEVIEKVRLKKQKKNEGKMQAIKKLKSETKTHHQKTIKNEKESRYLPLAKKIDTVPDEVFQRKESRHKKFHKFDSRAKAAELACTSNPDDIQNLRKWAFALTEKTNSFCEYEINHLDLLQDAQLKLQNVLQIDSNDHDAIFYLGMVHYLLLSYDKITFPYDEAHLYHCTKAIECFEAFQDDLIYQAPEDHDVSQMRMKTKCKLLGVSSYLQKLHEEYDMEVDNEILREEYLWDNIRVAKIENAKNPENVESLRSWAHAKIGLSSLTKNRKKKRKFYNEVLARLEQACKVNCKDKKLKLEFLHARLGFGDNEEKEKDTLVEEYIKLYEELNLHINEENSPWPLKTCQRNRKAVSSEDDDKPEVGFKPDEYKYLYKVLNPHHNDGLYDQSRVSKTVFVANLPCSVGLADIGTFFKDAGKVVGFRFPSNAAGKLKGYGDVEFNTVEAAHKAVEFNNGQFMGRSLRVELVKENIRGPCYQGRDGYCRDLNRSIYWVKDIRKNRLPHELTIKSGEDLF